MVKRYIISALRVIIRVKKMQVFCGQLLLCVVILTRSAVWEYNYTHIYYYYCLSNKKEQTTCDLRRSSSSLCVTSTFN